MNELWITPTIRLSFFQQSDELLLLPMQCIHNENSVAASMAWQLAPVAELQSFWMILEMGVKSKKCIKILFGALSASNLLLLKQQQQLMAWQTFLSCCCYFHLNPLCCGVKKEIGLIGLQY